MVWLPDFAGLRRHHGLLYPCACGLGLFTWVAMGICALAIFCIGICICDKDGLFGLTALSLLLSWLFSMALVYSIQHGRALPSYIYMMVGVPVALQFLMALLRSLGLLAGIGKAS